MQYESLSKDSVRGISSHQIREYPLHRRLQTLCRVEDSHTKVTLRSLPDVSPTRSSHGEGQYSEYENYITYHLLGDPASQQGHFLPLAIQACQKQVGSFLFLLG